MLIHQPSLADHFASLRATTASSPACAWLPDTLHALIMTVLARFFARLETLAQLWQAGHLPPLPTLPERTRTARRNTGTAARRHHIGTRATNTPIARAPIFRAPIRRVVFAPPRITTPTSGPHPRSNRYSARAPPQPAQTTALTGP